MLGMCNCFFYLSVHSVPATGSDGSFFMVSLRILISVWLNVSYIRRDVVLFNRSE